MAGYQDFTAGAVLTAAQVDGFLMEQTVMRFASEAARDSALSAVKTSGMLAVTLDKGERQWMYDGTNWIFQSYSGTDGRPGVLLTDAAQSIASSSSTDITWGTEVTDVDGWTSGASATLTVPTGWDGRYAITYSGSWASAPGANGSHALYVNGSAVYEVYLNSGSLLTGTISVVRTLAATDTLKVAAFQTSGSAINCVSRLEIAWLGR